MDNLDDQHSNHRDLVGKQHNGDVESKAEYDGEPHPTEGAVIVFLCALIEQNDNEKSQESKRNIAVNSPTERRLRVGPFVLREEAQSDAQSREQVDCGSDAFVSCYPIAQSPNIIEENIKDGHGDGGNPFTDAQCHSEVF